MIYECVGCEDLRGGFPSLKIWIGNERKAPTSHYTN